MTILSMKNNCQRCGGTGTVSAKPGQYEYAFSCSACTVAQNKRLEYCPDYMAEKFFKAEGYSAEQINKLCLFLKGPYAKR